MTEYIIYTDTVDFCMLSQMMFIDHIYAVFKTSLIRFLTFKSHVQVAT